MDTVYSSVTSELSKCHITTIKEFFETLRTQQYKPKTSSAKLLYSIYVVIYVDVLFSSAIQEAKLSVPLSP
jgi:hypothetical protein